MLSIPQQLLNINATAISKVIPTTSDVDATTDVVIVVAIKSVKEI